MLRPLSRFTALRLPQRGSSVRALQRGLSTSAPQDPRAGEGGSRKAAYLHHRSDSPMLVDTIGQLLGRAAATWSNRECVVSAHQNVRLSFAELLARADRLAAGLRKLGMQRGDRLGVWGPNDLEWYVCSMAAARAGFILVPVNPAYQLNELLYSVEKVGITGVVCASDFKTQNYPAMLLAVKEKCPTLKHVVVWSPDHVSGTVRFTDVEAMASRLEVEAVAAEQEAISVLDGCNIQFTSGTTGKPKATLLAHRSVVNNSAQATQRTELTERNRICMNVPFFHAFALLMAQISTLHAGNTLVLESRSFDPVKSLEVMLREKCDVAYGTPTMWINLMNAKDRIGCPPIQLHTGTTGGAPASPELYRRIKEAFHFENMKTIYGLTETTGIVFQSLPGEAAELTETTVGHLSDHVEAMVVDDNGTPVPFGAPGELWVRGYLTMVRYWHDHEATKKTFSAEGWLKTGDRFVMREDGYGQVVGRNKDMLIRGGENIFPREIEDFLMTHPLVLEAYVIGAHDDVYGEEVCACLRLREGARITKDELKNYCRGKIAHFKIPRYIEFVDEYPKTASGKVQKFRLKEEMERKGVIPARPAS